MCGIFGMFNLKEGGEFTADDLVRCTRMMIHRGPDDEGYYVNSNILLGHRRLSIIDLSGGRQPIFNEDRSMAIVYNGEIYNYRFLRSDLQRMGHTFRTMSDTEVILHAYEEYGTDCLRRLQGIFALAIYDIRNGTLFLARDHVGVKPLYYYRGKEGGCFSSEIKPILDLIKGSSEIDLKMVDFYMSLGYTPHPYTFFRNIRKIPPGSYATIRRDSMEIHSYWDLDGVQSNDRYPFSKAVNDLRETLRETIDSQLVSDVPVGVFLSGGLDSSTVVAWMHKLNVPEIKTFSVGYPASRDVSELEFARVVSKRFQTRHFEFNLEFDEFFQSVDTLLQFAEEPIVESAAIALYHLAKLAKTEATVLLSGEGADEIFAGYPIYRRMKHLEQLSYIFQFVPRCLINWASTYFPLTEKQKKYIDWISSPMTRRYKTVSSDVTPTIRRGMYTDDFHAYANDGLEDFFKYPPSNGGNEISILSQMLRLDTKYWLPDDLLLKADKMTMAASVELRVPFLDPRLVEFAASIPDRYKLRGREGKYILKKAMEGILPKTIIYRRKQGFPVPIREWFQGSLFERTREILLSNKFLSRGIFRKKYIEYLLGSHRSGEEDHSRRIFSLLTLELWMRRYADSQAG